MVYCPNVRILPARKKITAMPTQAPAGSHRLLQPALAAYSAPAMNVPEPIHVQMRVNTITLRLKDRPATMKSSWLLIFRER